MRNDRQSRRSRSRQQPNSKEKLAKVKKYEICRKKTDTNFWKNCQLQQIIWFGSTWKLQTTPEQQHTVHTDSTQAKVTSVHIKLSPIWINSMNGKIPKKKYQIENKENRSNWPHVLEGEQEQVVRRLSEKKNTNTNNEETNS